MSSHTKPKLTLPIRKTDREVMLCKEVIRRCRGEDSEWAYIGSDEWKIVDKHIVINNKVIYRAKPKSEE